MVIGIYIPNKTDFEYDAYGTEVEELEVGGIVIDPRQLYSDSPAGNTEIRSRIASGWLAGDGEGAYVIVRTENTYFLYAHLDPSSIRVGMRVLEGQTIGRIADEHLHFETRIHGAQTVEIDSETGDYEEVDKPLLAVNSIWYFNEEMQAKINEGLVRRNTEVTRRGMNEQYNATINAVTQNTQAIDFGARVLYVNNVTAANEQPFNRDAYWLHMTPATIVGSKSET